MTAVTMVEPERESETEQREPGYHVSLTDRYTAALYDPNGFMLIAFRIENRDGQALARIARAHAELLYRTRRLAGSAREQRVKYLQLLDEFCKGESGE